MMDVEIMRHIVDEVEQGTLPAVAQDAARRWCGTGSKGCVDSLVYVRSSANHVFRFLDEGKPRFLRLAHDTERRRAAIEAELDFIQHAAGAGLPVARPLPSARGALIEEVGGKGQRYYAVVFAGLPGRELELDELDEARFRAWGRALALLHDASQTFSPHPARPRWRDEIRDALRTLPPEETSVARVMTLGLAWLDTLAPDAWEYGLLHGDFELDNLIWEGEQVQVLDFDGASYGWYAVDLAAALQDVWLGDSTLRERRVTWFTEGYAAVRPLPSGLLRAMPRLLTLLQALKIAQVLQAYATTTDEDSPAWLAEMRTRHQRWLDARRAALVWE
jgi:Ser/Thr protein kinase RdoA (MazF antagonist)